jgi:DNA-binding transcriptional ArsR family regulator
MAGSRRVQPHPPNAVSDCTNDQLLDETQSARRVGLPILELLRDGERSVGALQKELRLDSGGTSQDLAALRRIGLVESRCEGTSVYYRVDDERVFDLLEAGHGIITRQLSEQQSILSELESS